MSFAAHSLVGQIRMKSDQEVHGTFILINASPRATVFSTSTRIALRGLPTCRVVHRAPGLLWTTHPIAVLSCTRTTSRLPQHDLYLAPSPPCTLRLVGRLCGCAWTTLIVARPVLRSSGGLGGFVVTGPSS